MSLIHAYLISSLWFSIDTKRNTIVSLKAQIFICTRQFVSAAPSYSVLTETGATQTMKTNQMAELKQLIPTFSKPANQMSSTKQWNLNLFVDWAVMFSRLRCRLNFKLKPVVFLCAYGFRNDYMLNSVYFKLVVDLENKSCVRVPLVVILPEYEMNHCCRDGLKKPFEWFVSSLTRTTFTRYLKGFF